MIVLDSHCDTPSQVVRLRDLGLDNRLAHIDFPKLKAGKVDACFFALYTSQSKPRQEALPYVWKMLEKSKEAVEKCPYATLATSTAEVYENKAKGLISILFGMENGNPVGESVSELVRLYEAGVRYVTLTHNGDNQIADSASQGTTWNGLSPFGEGFVAKMNELGMIVDLAHASDKTFYDCLSASSTPIVSTHSCCRALASHRRNMDDKMLRALADKGGVIQINFYPAFLSDDFNKAFSANPLSDEADRVEEEFIADPANAEKRQAWNNIQEKLLALDRPSYKRVVDHIDHAVNVAGVESVGLGSDFDGIVVPPAGLENASKMGVIFEEMRRRGYTDDAIVKIAGKNFLRVFSDVEKAAK